MAGAEKLILPGDYGYGGIESPTEEDILKCKEREMKQQFTKRYAVDVTEPLKTILSHRCVKGYTATCANDASPVHQTEAIVSVDVPHCDTLQSSLHHTSVLKPAVLRSCSAFSAIP